jgi:hypothetical protein
VGLNDVTLPLHFTKPNFPQNAAIVAL